MAVSVFSKPSLRQDKSISGLFTWQPPRAGQPEIGRSAQSQFLWKDNTVTDFWSCPKNISFLVWMVLTEGGKRILSIELRPFKEKTKFPEWRHVVSWLLLEGLPLSSVRTGKGPAICNYKQFCFDQTKWAHLKGVCHEVINSIIFTTDPSGILQHTKKVLHIFDHSDDEYLCEIETLFENV